MDPHCKELCSHSFLHCTKYEQLLEISGGNQSFLADVEIGHIFYTQHHPHQSTTTKDRMSIEYRTGRHTNEQNSLPG
jgi:hypothetical protein